ncbi:MAG: hypothetical protein ACE37J_11985 [Pikeienuella sp.]|uniref:hypothetical protein n=1 Tax=Pikeienuella sp. TaxID=2831957 RepID=UPI00391D21F6
MNQVTKIADAKAGKAGAKEKKAEEKKAPPTWLKVDPDLMLAATLTMSTDPARHYINGIHLHLDEDDTARIVTTDGKLLFCATIFLPAGLPTWLAEGLTIAGEGLPGLLKVVAKRASAGLYIEPMEAGGHLWIRDNAEPAMATVSFRQSIEAGAFPDYRRILSTDAFAGAESVAGQGVVMDAGVFKVAQAISKQIHDGDKNDPQRVEFFTSRTQANVLTFTRPGCFLMAMPLETETVHRQTQQVLSGFTNGTVAALRAHRTRIEKELSRASTEADRGRLKAKMAEYDDRIRDVIVRLGGGAGLSIEQEKKTLQLEAERKEAEAKIDAAALDAAVNDVSPAKPKAPKTAPTTDAAEAPKAEAKPVAAPAAAKPEAPKTAPTTDAAEAPKAEAKPVAAPAAAKPEAPKPAPTTGAAEAPKAEAKPVAAPAAAKPEAPKPAEKPAEAPKAESKPATAKLH